MKFQILDHTGHSTLDFDKHDPLGLAGAQEKFQELLDKGHRPATRKANTTDYNLIKRFDQVEDETLWVPHLKGG